MIFDMKSYSTQRPRLQIAYRQANSKCGTKLLKICITLFGSKSVYMSRPNMYRDLTDMYTHSVSELNLLLQIWNTVKVMMQSSIQDLNSESCQDQDMYEFEVAFVCK